MADLQEQFETAAAEAQQLSKRPDNDALLRLYSLYKQSTAGDIAGRRPGFTNPVGRAKYDAWAKLRGKSSEWAMQAYIDKVGQLQGE